jgi:hypothetical protein
MRWEGREWREVEEEMARSHGDEFRKRRTQFRFVLVCKL